MAKKVIAKLRIGEGKGYTKVIRMVKSDKKDSYTFKEVIIPSENVKEYLKGK